jgi:hypothetical protein
MQALHQLAEVAWEIESLAAALNVTRSSPFDMILMPSRARAMPLYRYAESSPC